MRIAVDGVSAAGKTTFADQLADLLCGVARITIDDYHRPPPQKYYPDSFDFDAFRTAVLATPRPLVPDRDAVPRGGRPRVDRRPRRGHLVDSTP